jgi:hypothetical protein
MGLAVLARPGVPSSRHGLDYTTSVSRMKQIRILTAALSILLPSALPAQVSGHVFEALESRPVEVHLGMAAMISRPHSPMPTNHG